MRWHLAVAVLVTGTLALTIGRSAGKNIGVGPGRACKLPSRTCTEGCDELVEMPLVGFGYIDNRIVEEMIEATSTSFLRRDFTLLVQYAAAKVACKAATWNTGHGAPLGLGDMSHRDGGTPGLVWGAPRHPWSTHTDGLAIDIAYYQRDTPDNELRPVCRHFDRSGAERWRCLAAPDRLDASRTALFIGALLEEPRIRVIGVDGHVAPPVLAAFDELCRTDWIDKAACARRRLIRYETRNDGHGWFRGHHNHLHAAWQR